MFLELKFPTPKETIAMLEAEYHKIETAIMVSTDASKTRLERKLLEKIEKEVALWRDKKLTAKNGRISIAITGHDDFYDVGLFYDKACHLQSVLERQVKLLDMRHVEMGNIAPSQLPNNIRRLGYLAEPGIEIYSYVDRYSDGGTIQPMIPDDVCFFVSPEVNTIMAYGAIANGWSTNGAPNLERGTRFSFERPHDSL